MRSGRDGKVLDETLRMLERCIKLVQKYDLREATGLLRLAKADLQRHQHGITEQELDVALSLLRCGNLVKSMKRTPK